MSLLDTLLELGKEKVAQEVSPASPESPEETSTTSEPESNPRPQPIRAEPTAPELDYPSERCRVCGSYLFWVSTHGTVICVTCHPPASAKLVRCWFWVSEGNREAERQWVQ